jgi:hypothetical protein
MTPDQVSHYRVFEEIGRGAMGVVHRAEDTRLKRPVALKFLSEKLAEDRQALERLHREARASSALNHPNICTIHDIAAQDGRTFLVMELLHGQTLRDRIAGKPLPPVDLVEYGIQMADALDAAHKQGIIHRDIKPTNLFITDRGQIKILDFGIAKLESHRLAPHSGPGTGPGTTVIAEETLTKGGATVGTLAYMSPEQARGERLDGRSDIFALGIVLYEMATGKPAFAGDTTAVLFDAILNRAPESLLRLNPQIPAELERIVLKAMEKDRELRYQAAAELRADLRRLKRDIEAGRVRLRRKGGRLRIAMAAAGLIVVGGAAVGIPLGWYRHASDHSVLAVTPRALTSNASSVPVWNAAISPDGKYISYVDSTGVYVKPVGTEDIHRLKVPDGIRGRKICWFPDGVRLLLSASGQGDMAASLWTLSILGGEPLKVREDASAGVVSPDGSKVAFLPGVRGQEIWIADTDGGEPRRIATASKGLRYGCLAWMPDGNWLIVSCWKAGASGASGSIESHRIDGRKVSVLTESPHLAPTVDSGLWCTSGGDVLFCMAELPPHTTDANLWKIQMDPRAGGPKGRAERLTDWVGVTVEAPSLAGDGSRMAILKSTARADILVGNLDAGGTALSGVRRVTEGPGDSFPTGWKPDGSSLLLMSNRGGTYDVFEQEIGGGAAEARILGPDNEGGAFYTKNPEELLYWKWAVNDGREAFDAQLMRLPRDGSSAKPILVTRRRLVSIASLTGSGSGCAALIMDPQAKRLVIDSIDVVAGTLSEKAHVDLDPAEWIQWLSSPDGRRVALLGPNGRIRILHQDGTFERDIALKEWGDALRSIAWSADGTGFFGVWSTAGASVVLRIGMGGEAQPLYQSGGAPLGDVVCSPDLRHVAFTRLEVERNAFLLEGLRLQGTNVTASSR